MSTTFDFSRALHYGAIRDAAIMDLALRFRYVQVEDVADLCCQGRMKVARRRLLALYRQGRLRRFTLGPFEPFIYTPGKRSQKANHSLTVLRAYRALRTVMPSGWRLTAYDPEYELTAGDRRRVMADALVVLDNEMARRRRAVFFEANLDPVFDQAAGYADLLTSRALRKTWWWREGVEVIAAVATIRPDYVRRLVAQESQPEITWVVSPIADLVGLWKEAFRVSTVKTTRDDRQPEPPARYTSAPDRPSRRRDGRS